MSLKTVVKRIRRIPASQGDAAGPALHTYPHEEACAERDENQSVRPPEPVPSEGKAKRKWNPDWFFNIAVALFAGGFPLVADEKQRVLGIPMITVGAALILISFFPLLRVLWTLATATFLLTYLLLYLPRFKNRSVDAYWTLDPPLSKVNESTQNDYMPRNFDNAPPAWIRWSGPASLIWQAIAPRPKTEENITVDNGHEMTVNDTAPVLFPPLSDSRRPISNFDLDLTFDFKNAQDVAAWAIRTDEAATHYYLFVVARAPSDTGESIAQIHAWKIAGNKGKLIDSTSQGPTFFDFPLPEKPFTMEVHLEASAGCEFTYKFIFAHGLSHGGVCAKYAPFRVNDESCYLQGRPALVDFSKLSPSLDQVTDSPGLIEKLRKSEAAKVSDVRINWGNGKADEEKCVPIKATISKQKKTRSTPR